LLFIVWPFFGYFSQFKLKKKEEFSMRKKKWFNSRIFSTMTILFVLCCFMATSAWAARKIKVYTSNAKSYIKQLNAKKSHERLSLKSVLNLSQDEDFKLLRMRRGRSGLMHYRSLQTFKDIPVWGMQTIVSVAPSDQVVRVHGTLVLDIGNDIGDIPASLDALGALERMKDDHKGKDKKAKWHFENERYGTYIYIHKNGKAYLSCVVSFFADTDKGNPSRYVHIIDAKTGRTLNSFDMLQHADGTGPGGNEKIGYYEYGNEFPPFGVTQNGNNCVMNTTDVKTVDLNHGTGGSTAYSYTCPENTHKEINGAYCPLNDAQFFGQVVFDMYNDWYGVAPLPFQLTMRCHYSTNYENAFWNGSTMTFGDGYTRFYPLVSLDVSAHEVSHGFTEFNSDLIYAAQSGGINEAFSDMSGEAAEFYLRGSNDFLIGFDIFKNPTEALRYMGNPPQDGHSIGHVNDYYSGMDVHYSSGVFNKAFYLIATTPGWDTHKAFDIFVKANQDYWNPSTGFYQGAEGVRDAALDLGYDCYDVTDAFAVVGITLDCPGPPGADFSGSPTSGSVPLTVHFTDLSLGEVSAWLWDFGDGGTSTDQNPSHTYTTLGTFTVSLTATNAFGSDTITKTDYITGTGPQPPVADFIASSTYIGIGDSITFTDLSNNNPTSWNWTFEGGTPGSSTAQNPTVTYNTTGTYTVTLTVANALGSDTVTRVGYITVLLQAYCASSADSQEFEYIDRVVVADLDNPSGASPYSDFTNLVAHITQGETVYVDLYPHFPNGSHSEWWKIRIDYNRDGDFADAGEEVFRYDSITYIQYGIFTVPTITVTGDTRMRVSMSYSTYAPACGTFTRGEVEDYTVHSSAGRWVLRSIHRQSRNLGLDVCRGYARYQHPEKSQDYL
jgi:Zn-dependent metalloprotease